MPGEDAGPAPHLPKGLGTPTSATPSMTDIPIQNLIIFDDFNVGSVPQSPVGDMPEVSPGGAASVEYVDFSGLDGLTGVVKSGFKSLIDIASKILSTVSGVTSQEHLPKGLPVVVGDGPLQPMMEIPLERLLVPDVTIPAPASPDASPDAGRDGARLHIENTFNIYQQPGEDAEALTAKVLEVLERQRRVSYYD